MGTLQMDPSAPNAPFHNDTRRYISLPNVVRRGNAIKGRHFPGTPRRSGFTLVEVLCIVAIVAILVGLSLAVLTKGIARAYRVDVINMLRNGAVNAQARIAIGVAGAQLPRDICRATFRVKVNSNVQEVWFTQMRYQVANDDEFRAYWHTLIDVANNAPLEFTADGKLIANDEDGNIFELKPITPGESMATVPLTWEFLSSDMTETALRSRGITTLFSGSNIEYIPYPGRFPCTPTVAELSHRFVVGLSVD